MSWRWKKAPDLIKWPDIFQSYIHNVLNRQNNQNKYSELSIIPAWYLSFKNGMMWRIFNSDIGQILANITINRNVILLLLLLFSIPFFDLSCTCRHCRHMLLHGVYCLKTVCVTMDPYQCFVIKQTWLFATSKSSVGIRKRVLTYWHTARGPRFGLQPGAAAART